MTNKLTGATLQQARLEAGISLREAARRAGTSHATLSAYENGRKTPSIATFHRLIKACGYALDIQLKPRIRQANGVSRGDELIQALELAEQFPSRFAKKREPLKFPRLPLSAHS